MDEKFKGLEFTQSKFGIQLILHSANLVNTLLKSCFVFIKQKKRDKRPSFYTISYYKILLNNKFSCFSTD